MRLIDADKLRKDVIDLPNCYNGFSDTYDKAMIIDLVDEQPTVDAEPIRHGTEYEEDEVSKMLNEIDYWRKYCDLLERTIIKLAIRYMKRDEGNAEKCWQSVESVGGDR